MLPPTMAILVRGTAVVLGLTTMMSAAAGAVCGSALMALNACGFVGVCALSATAVFYAVALERIGLSAASTAATTLVRVMAGSAVVMTVVLFALMRAARFRDEASRLGWHSAAGIAVLVVLAAVLALLWRER